MLRGRSFKSFANAARASFVGRSYSGKQSFSVIHQSSLKTTKTDIIDLTQSVDNLLYRISPFSLHSLFLFEAVIDDW
ncbi:hypothetical protein AKO1_012555 [Acrasis kona]|uniref:Uncharacterized protein n=1 Tax=Acrasis kona TaxID=1008807 RepID=A0AAW2YXK5_9EUKA